MECPARCSEGWRPLIARRSRWVGGVGSISLLTRGRQGGSATGGGTNNGDRCLLRILRAHAKVCYVCFVTE